MNLALAAAVRNLSDVVGHNYAFVMGNDVMFGEFRFRRSCRSSELTISLPKLGDFNRGQSRRATPGLP